MQAVDGFLNSFRNFIWKSRIARTPLFNTTCRAKFQEKLVSGVTSRPGNAPQLVFIFRKPRQTGIINSCTSPTNFKRGFSAKRKFPE